jgi:hypothetical protein
MFALDIPELAQTFTKMLDIERLRSSHGDVANVTDPRNFLHLLRLREKGSCQQDSHQ